MKTNLFSSLKQDASAGVVVFLVALPLCLGIALASGAPLFSGLIAGIVGGVIISLISNSQLSVSGPAAGLAAIVLSAITSLGSFEVFLSAVVIGGVIQLLLGFLKAGTIANYFPSNVIRGMLAAIGIIIILKQIPHAFGYDRDVEGDLAFLQPDGENTFSELFNVIGNIDVGATLFTLLSLAILILWERPFMRKFKVVPGALVAVIVCILLNYFFGENGSSLAVSNKHLVNIPVAASFGEFVNQFTLPDFSRVFSSEVLISGVTIAIVASIETLLCIEAVDKIDPQKRVTSTNLELKAQGVGNIVSGLIGGLPITSVIVRSSANVNAGGKTKMAAFMHGALLLLSVIFIPKLINQIPLSSLAAILLVTGYKLANPAVFKEMISKGFYQWLPFMITIVAVVFTNLLLGVAIGMVIAVFFILREYMKEPYFYNANEKHDSKPIEIKLGREVSFLNKASILLTLDHLPEGSTVELDASETRYIDHDVVEIIREFKDVKAGLKNIDLKLIGFRPEFKLT